MQQTVSRPGPNTNSNHNGSSQSQKIIITAITLFALSGLVIGFAVGAITRPPQAAQPTPTIKSSPIASQKATPSPTPIQKAPLGCPVVDSQPFSATADGTTPYTVQAHATDKSGECLKGKPMQQAGITCKLWLSRVPGNGKIDIPNSALTKVDSLQQPIGGNDEVVNGLTFDPTTPQTQKCDSKGQATWKFSIAPDVKRGSYDFVVLTDWDGAYANWSWVPLEIKKGQG